MLHPRRRDELEHSIWILGYVAGRMRRRGNIDAAIKLEDRAREIERAIDEDHDILVG